MPVKCAPGFESTILSNESWPKPPTPGSCVDRCPAAGNMRSNATTCTDGPSWKRCHLTLVPIGGSDFPTYRSAGHNHGVMA